MIHNKIALVFLGLSSVVYAQTVQDRLDALGIVLPQVTKPVANYVSVQRAGSTLYVSGQLPVQDGGVKYKGQVGHGLTEQEAVEAARLCALHILAQVQAAVGSLENVRCVKLEGMVSADGQYTRHPVVINGASDLMVEVLGKNGEHARVAVGVSGLPLGAAVEIAAIFELLN